MTKRKNRVYTDEFRQEAVALVTEQSYTVIETAASSGITSKLIYNWKNRLEMESSGQSLNVDERTELALLRKENKQLRLEKDILKKASAFGMPLGYFAKEMK